MVTNDVSFNWIVFIRVSLFTFLQFKIILKIFSRTKVVPSVPFPLTCMCNIKKPINLENQLPFVHSLLNNISYKSRQKCQYFMLSKMSFSFNGSNNIIHSYSIDMFNGIPINRLKGKTQYWTNFHVSYIYYFSYTLLSFKYCNNF